MCHLSRAFTTPYDRVEHGLVREHRLAPAGDGRSTSPFDSLAPATGGPRIPDGNGDVIFVYARLRELGPITLETSSKAHRTAERPRRRGPGRWSAAGGSNPGLVDASGDSSRSVRAVPSRASRSGLLGDRPGGHVGTLTIGTTASVDVANRDRQGDRSRLRGPDRHARESVIDRQRDQRHQASNTSGTFTVNSGSSGNGTPVTASCVEPDQHRILGVTIKDNLGSGIKGTGVTGSRSSLYRHRQR